MKKNITLILFALLAISAATFAQSVGINSTGAAPDASAMLDVSSTTKGFLAPRMTAEQRGLISSPATGLLVYQTDGTAGYYYYNGSVWTQIGAASGSTQWTTTGSDIYYNSGNVGVGTTNLQGRLTIGGFGHGVAAGITMIPDNNTAGGHYMTFTNAGYTTAIGSIARGPGNTVVYNTSSDYRLKENVVNISANEAKSRLMSLRPVEYNYISDENKTVISGFLAHEMADAGFANGVIGVKDAVDKDGKPIYQAIDTKFLIPEMVKVIQEQQTEIDALKKELDEIKKMIQYKK